MIDHIMIAYKGDIDKAGKALLEGDVDSVESSASRLFQSNDLKLLSVEATTWGGGFMDEIQERLGDMPPGPKAAFGVICGALLCLSGVQALVVVGFIVIIASIWKFGRELRQYLLGKLDKAFDKIEDI